MYKIFKNTKIYVYCPAGHASGGAELLHQLVSLLRDGGKNAFLILTGTKEHKVHPEYINYNIELAEAIEDNEHNIEVLYEPEFYRACLNTKTQKILWWLSVDNFFTSGTSFLSPLDVFIFCGFKLGFRTLCGRIVYSIFRRKEYRKRYHPMISLKAFSKLDIVSAYQSEYAQFFLQSNGFKEMIPLKDFINSDHIGQFDKRGRESIVLYNPKKGYKFTKRLIAQAPDINWVPISNMTRKQVIELMNKSKVYIDFGFHPGKDRLPRECAMNGLCIITGSRGSAGFFEDVWLENKYKFDENKCNYSEIISRIRETLDNYDSAIDDFALYRMRISLEKGEFERQVKEYFLDL